MTPKKKRELSPEQIMRRKFRAKCRFRALGRLVMANTYWLIEGIDEYEGIEDVQRRVEQAVRAKKKKKLLKINDKALLNKPAEERTDFERLYLFKIIGDLKCFKRYPNHVKRKLASVAYYKYYDPGRTVVRQHQEAHALYFIVHGDVVISQTIYDELLHQYQSVDVGEMHDGDMFGEISLLHNIARTATVTTKTHCEFICLLKEDFKNVLQTSIQKQWDAVLTAMSNFSYFNELDEVSKREGCIVAKMKSYQTEETVLGDGVGVANHVYFILKGRCQMIESLQVNVTTRLGKEYYTLWDPYVPKEESNESLDTKYFKAYENKMRQLRMSGTTEISSSSYETPSAMRKQSTNSRVSKIGVGFSTSQPEIAPSESARRISSGLSPIMSAGRDASRDFLHSFRQSIEPGIAPNLKKEQRTYFMQVCQFNPGASFGFGENMRDRRIIALTPMEVMLMPKIWLLQKNTANIWTRIEYYLSKKIPSKKKLFEEFVSQRNWKCYREDLVEEIISKSKTVNSTTVHDVPYSIRLDEMVDIANEEVKAHKH